MILSIIIALCLAGSLFAFWSRKRPALIARWTALALVACGIVAMFLFIPGTGYRLIDHFAWLDLAGLEVAWTVGVDGISMPLILLTLLLALVSVLISEREVHSGESSYYGLLLLLVAGVLGVFSSLNLVMFFVFWEIVLVAIFLLVLMWGHSNSRYAAIKLIVYTGIGSLALLLAILMLGVHGGTFDISLLDWAMVPEAISYVVLGLLLFAFFIKMPIVPFHTWLPDAHVQAPTAGSVMLAGVLLKMGAYGLMRLGTPLGAFDGIRLPLFIAGAITLIYGAFLALGQSHLKRLVAYSSVNHMGIVLMGIAAGSALGTVAAVFEMVSHGILSALLFGLAGLVYERTGTYDLSALRGLVQKMPKVSWLIVIGALGALGLPGLSGFVAEFIVFIAAFEAFGFIALIPIAGIVITGAYVVRLIGGTIFGQGPQLRGTESGASLLPFSLLVIASVVIGVLPFLLLGVMG